MIAGGITRLRKSDKKISNGSFLWVFRCHCGKEFNARKSDFNRGKVRSCGCVNRRVKHGGSRAGWYKSLKNAIQRCHNPNNQRYESYGARGIVVYKKWREEPSLFYKHLGERPEGMTLERIKTDGNYEPGNVRWCSMWEQMHNMSTNVLDWDKATEIRTLAEAGFSVDEIKTMIGVECTDATIKDCIKGRTWCEQIDDF